MLQGTLDTLSLPELFDVLSATKKSGALHVRGSRGLGVVYFDAGAVCAAEAGAQSGPVDTEIGVVARLHDVCFELFRYETGSFEFEPGGPPRWPVLCSLGVDVLVEEAGRRLTEWKDIEAVVPSVECRPWLVAEAPGNQVVLDRAQWKMVTAIAGRRRVSAIMRLLEASEFDVCRTLKTLVDIGLVEIEMPSALEGSDTTDASLADAGLADAGLADAGLADGTGTEPDPLDAETATAPSRRRSSRKDAVAAHDSAEATAESPGHDAAAEALHDLAQETAEPSGDGDDGDDRDPEFKEALVKFLSTVHES